MAERDTQYEEVDPRRHVAYRDPHDFDRLEFAMRALDRLRPAMTVAVYAAVSTLSIERGRGLTPDGKGSWAVVGIPPGASREHIAYALAELVGVASVPYAVAMLLAPFQARE